MLNVYHTGFFFQLKIMHITVWIWSWRQAHEEPKHIFTLNRITLWAESEHNSGH